MAPPIQPDPQLLGSAASSFKGLFARLLAPLATLFFALSSISDPGQLTVQPLERPDPCAAIAGKEWVAPSDVRACFTSFKVDPVEKENVGANYNLAYLTPSQPVINIFSDHQIVSACTKILNFHASTNYQIRAPQPFTNDVHEDLVRDLQRINGTRYPNDLLFHIDVSRSFKRLNDGHALYINFCYDGKKPSKVRFTPTSDRKFPAQGLYDTVIPLPLVHLTNRLGSQFIHIAPEAFNVAKSEFPDEIKFWQDSLPGNLKGNLESVREQAVVPLLEIHR